MNIHDAWCRETSAAPDDWSPSNPARGQCAVTALLIQDVFGGSLLRGVVQGESHYWNILPDGTEMDLTIQQFPPRHRHRQLVEARARTYVLSFPDTVRRYELLRQRVLGG